MIKKYRKKPVVIEAIQFTNSADIHEFCRDKVREPVGEDYLEIITLEGVMRAEKGDYVIKGVAGEFYPCKPDIFELTYELVTEPDELRPICGCGRPMKLVRFVMDGGKACLDYWSCGAPAGQCPVKNANMPAEIIFNEDGRII